MQDVTKLETLFSEARAVLEEGDYQKAIEIYSGILTDWKDYTEARERANASLGEVYTTLRNLELAEEHLKQAMSYNPSVPHYHYLLGFAYSVDRQWDKARIEYKFAVKQDPKNTEYLRGLGWVLYNCGRAPEGRRYLLRALTLAPDNVSILTNLALVHADAGEFDKALDYAQRAASIAPTNTLVQLVQEVLASVWRLAAKNTHDRNSNP